MLVAPQVALPDTAPDDPRVGHLLGRDAAGAAVVLVGFPTDEGVRRNGGRPGAAEGPAALRRALYRLTPDARAPGPFTALLARTVDLGDVAPEGPLEANQERLAAVLAPHLARGAFAVVLGGGHETAYGHFLGHAAAGAPVALLNWDAHPDVRPLREGRAHSGSPFLQALGHPACRGYTVAGLLPHAVASAHLDTLAAYGARALWRDELSPDRVEALYAGLEGRWAVSFDLDAVDAAYAPGVSAPACGGLAPDGYLRAAFEAGRCPAVASADVVELCPPFDVDGRTARLAALVVWHLLRGLAARPLPAGPEAP